MKRWILAFLIALVACWPFVPPSGAVGALSDSDTKEILRVIRLRKAALSWFVGDWPIPNHFYRPLPSLAFELDNRLYGDNDHGYLVTNAFICAACSLLVFWFARELSDSPFFAAVASVLFSRWTVDGGSSTADAVMYAALLVLAIGGWRWRARFRGYVPATLLTLFLSGELAGHQSLQMRVLGWLPGRTATIMTMFMLIALAAYVRFERLGAKKMETPVTATTKPATKSATIATRDRRAWIWAVISMFGLALAFASYEQAVMGPACFVAVAVYMRAKGFRVGWVVPGLAFVLLAGYLAYRHHVLPPGLSNYQKQQLRFGPGAWNDALSYLAPCIYEVRPLINTLSTGLAILLFDKPWVMMLSIVVNLVALWQIAVRKWREGFALMLLSFWAFLPMAFSKSFDHYHYWPMAMRSVFVAFLVFFTWDRVRSAISLPPVSAPARDVPAPGSEA